jgi:hypothetical protein
MREEARISEQDYLRADVSAKPICGVFRFARRFHLALAF